MSCMMPTKLNENDIEPIVSNDFMRSLYEGADAQSASRMFNISQQFVELIFN